jgi:hypothetical protein
VSTPPHSSVRDLRLGGTPPSLSGWSPSYKLLPLVPLCSTLSCSIPHHSIPLYSIHSLQFYTTLFLSILSISRSSLPLFNLTLVYSIPLYCIMLKYIHVSTHTVVVLKGGDRRHVPLIEFLLRG